ncbi:MAG: HD domain-containing protein [Candidatus Altiarchaeum hamiconexum]|uniref:HD domain-containing protein n=1 Tax=Candidatus Altarchaeum hamiconexum TaxID=1803513 RepID=A0A8J8CFQ3_9ARCH|nr:HD domain-containing protein [Candidatus Altarchaeum hamiconexum]PIN67667.1 MAG: metal-dependent phosphohydrolase [Candidatus Altarchaeum sp. CG12_big_fil_rev_8_21_14_0_65_33_22]PIV28931.1 MAG: metal-dependent phosphohydrolase [Candidatus Altarchaeum sp. CG03_land_8_20_14_0_80_32_618]PIX49112.1 MAG: metal-dependent phosphohydrolase [Candidatus Altarchaeum sp. CG_4_8_14_3_um_filter_33_2054]PIZ30933.1 MAG: metal-dependent phosphohydrolase [Candidatus Altarchaeum sp. CG_4_10_14_0_8_um_filter_32
MFCECKWKDNVNFGVLDELKKKADFVEWNKQKRKDYFILFAKLFEQEFKKHSEENNILCVDLKYIEQFFKRMKTKDIKFFRQFFKAYANGFYSDNYPDNGTNNEIIPNLKLKEDHTYRVLRNIVHISKSLNLREEEINLAKAIALFHDIGRFEQLKHYKTFLDRNSESHSEIALRVLNKEGVINRIDEKEREILITAIKFHNVREIPEISDEKTLFFCKLIRDADKIDIFKVWIDYFNHKSVYDPSYGMDLSISQGYSDNIISDIFANKMSPLEKVKTYNDIKLLLLTWIYDINFDASLNLILCRGYIQKIFKILPKNEEMKKVREHINLDTSQC